MDTTSCAAGHRTPRRRPSATRARRQPQARCIPQAAHRGPTALALLLALALVFCMLLAQLWWATPPALAAPSTAPPTAPPTAPAAQDEVPDFIDSWNYSCEAGAKRLDSQQMGVGLGDRDEYFGAQQIDITNPDSVEFIIAQVTTRAFAKAERVEFRTPTQSLSLTEPSVEVLDARGRVNGYIYQVVLAGSAAVTAEIFGAQDAASGFYLPRALTLFVFRSDTSFSATGRTLYDFVYNNATTETLTVPSAPQPRDIQLELDIVDLAVDERFVEIRAQAGTIEASERISNSNQGAELAFVELLLPDVPGDVTEVEVTIDSPPKPDGASAILGGLNARVECSTAALGDRVFEDANENGVQDGNETGVTGVTVNLWLDEDGDGSPDMPIASQVSGDEGQYLFGSLDPRLVYIVEFIAPDGRTFTARGQGGDPALDSDADSLTGLSAPQRLAPGATVDTVDAGLLPVAQTLASLGDTVFRDLNGNGLQDAGEPGVPGVSVNLLAQNGDPLAATTSDRNGRYTFPALNPGTYIVEFVTPESQGFTLPNAGDDALDSDADPVSGQSEPLTLVAGENNRSVDAGLLSPAPAALGDRVFLDANENGVQDGDEPGVPDITVNLWLDTDGDGQPDRRIGSTTTNDDGLYGFDDLDPTQSYIVEFVAPIGRDFSAPFSGDDPALDSDADPLTGWTPSFTLAPGQTDDSVDAGLLPVAPELAALGDRVFRDLNGNGLQDDDEPGVPNITVILTADANANGIPDDLLIRTRTNVNGRYSFAGLDPAQTYAVKFVAPNGQRFTVPNAGNDPALDSDADPATGVTPPLTLAAGENNLSIDAGLLPTAPGLAALGDTVFEDANGNGLQDEGEPGVGGVAINLLQDDGDPATPNEPVDSTTTVGGRYGFFGLDPALTYIVEFVAPDGRLFTAPNAGDDALDSDADPTTGQTPPLTLAAEETNNTVDAGLLPLEPPLGSIGDTVFCDVNGNGQADNGEGIAGVTVSLTPADGSLAPALDVAGANGDYLFDNLPAGGYTVAVDPSTLPADCNVPAIDSSEPDAPADGLSVVELPPGAQISNVDFGFGPPGPTERPALGDRVFEDPNENGLQDEGEPGVPNVVINLLLDGDGDGEPDRKLDDTTTDENGLYRFPNLDPARTYILEFVPPSGRSFTAPNAGDDQTVDSDANPLTGYSPAISLADGLPNDTVDAGLLPTPPDLAALGDFVFRDLNGNGLQDEDEPGVPGVRVNLRLDDEGDGLPNAQIRTTLTDRNGRYSFAGLGPALLYIVEFIEPDGRTFTTQDAGSDDEANDALDSDVDPNTGRTATLTLAAGDLNLTVDAGLRQLDPGVLGDRIWLDKNGDGVQDEGEPGINGVRAELLNEGGEVIATTFTTVDGNYRFQNLPAGTYSVRLDPNTVPSAYEPTGELDDALDGSVTLPLAADEINLDVDFGFVPGPEAGTLAIGDFVWVDANGNGIQDRDEPGVPGVVITLFDGDTPLGETLTNVDGRYRFPALLPGSYTVAFAAPSANYTLTQPGQGNPTNDSNPAVETGRSDVVPLVDSNELSIDAGYTCTSDVSGLIWNDENLDGIFDVGEPTIPEAPVALRIGRERVAKTYTDANGRYTFPNLDPGVTYNVKVDLNFTVSRFTPTVENPVTDIVLVRCGSADISFGFALQPGAVGDLLWYDANQNGEDDEWYDGNNNGLLDRSYEFDEWYAPDPLETDTEAGEGEYNKCGLSYVTVILFDSDGNEVARTETGFYGWYAFFGLEAGSYTVDVDTTDPDYIENAQRLAASGLCRSGPFEINPDDLPLTQSVPAQSVAKALAAASLLAEERLAAAADSAVAMLAATGESLTQTRAKLAALDKRIFQQEEEPEVIYECAPTSDTSVSGELVIDPEDPENSVNLDFDSGIYCAVVSLGDFVWLDINNDGIQDEGEPGLPDLTVTLFDSEDNFVLTTTTSVTGTYAFTDLLPGSYSVEFDAPVGSYEPTLSNVNDDTPEGDALDSDMDFETRRVEDIDIGGGSAITTDAGFVCYVSINGFIWHDLNRNGEFDAGEPPLPNVTLIALGDADLPNKQGGTDATGYYEIRDLPTNGTYTLDVNNQFAASGLVPLQSEPVFGIEPELCGTANVNFPYVAPTNLIGDLIWYDANGNGLQDEWWDENRDGFLNPPNFDNILEFTSIEWFEPSPNDETPEPQTGEYHQCGVDFVDVQLLDENGNVVDDTSTDLFGYYTFTDVPAGSYSVRVDPDDAGYPERLRAMAASGKCKPLPFTVRDSEPGISNEDEPTAPTYLCAATTPAEQPATVVADTVDATYDFGSVCQPPASIGDRLWLDANGNGVQDPGEPGLNNVTVRLLDGDGNEISRVQTSGDGNYLFPGLLPGTYTITIDLTTLPAGATFTFDADSALDGTTTVALEAGQMVETLDFGVQPPPPVAGSVGDRVWLDENGNGVQDAGEPGVNNVTVRLLDGDGSEIATELTADNGLYSFGPLAAGTYTVVLDAMTLPAGYAPTYELDGSLDGSLDGRVELTLSGGEARTDVDFGFLPAPTPGTIQLGDFVWLDENGNGLQDEGEPGVAGVTVKLWVDNDDNGEPDQVLRSTESGPSGGYRFVDLDPALTYMIEFVAPAEQRFTPVGMGNEALDSNAGEDGFTDPIQVEPGATELSVDAGLLPAAAPTALEETGEPTQFGFTIFLPVTQR